MMYLILSAITQSDGSEALQVRGSFLGVAMIADPGPWAG